LSQSAAKGEYNAAYGWWETVGKTVELSTDSSGVNINPHKDQIQAPVYLDYEQPNYKVRVGNFISRDEAKEFATSFEGSFQSHFIIPSRILR